MLYFKEHIGREKVIENYEYPHKLEGSLSNSGRGRPKGLTEGLTGWLSPRTKRNTSGRRARQAYLRPRG